MLTKDSYILKNFISKNIKIQNMQLVLTLALQHYTYQYYRSDLKNIENHHRKRLTFPFQEFNEFVPEVSDGSNLLN